MNFIKLFETGAEGDSYEQLKELAREDLGVLKQITFLNNMYHGDDPRFTSKEAKTAMSAVLTKLFYKDDRTAYFMGQFDWVPNLPVWMRFFDMVGEKPLGAYLGIKSQNDLPKFGEEGGDEGQISGDDPVSMAFPDTDGADLSDADQLLSSEGATPPSAEERDARSIMKLDPSELGL